VLSDPKEIAAALAEPFAADEVEWKPQSVSKAGNKALAICYIDSRAVMDRLDDVVGPGAWQDTYEILPDGCAVCRLQLLIAGVWVEKADVGGPSDQKDAGDKRKASFSDALKRAAVKWGVGRYLYRLGGQWVDYDADRKQLKAIPALPAWALPKGSTPSPAPASKPTAAVPGEDLVRRIEAAREKLKIKPEAFAAKLQKTYGVLSVDRLNRADLEDLVTKMESPPAPKGKAGSAA
jgi:hypothetical protein